MISRTMGAVWLMLAIGCVAAEPTEPTGPEATSEIDQLIGECPGCGGNGMRQGWWNYVFSTLDKAALDSEDPALDLWDNGMASPMSLCRDGTPLGTTSCTIRDGWHAWLQREPSLARQGIFMEIVRVSLPKGYKVVDTSGTVFRGDFGLILHARTSSWRQDGRELASAGMLALLSAVPDVQLCLNTRLLPNNCHASGATRHESATFGDAIFGSRFIAISGGADYPEPLSNPRYGSVSPGSATSFSWYDGHCTFAGSGSDRYPISCTGNGTTWTNVVNVLRP